VLCEDTRRTRILLERHKVEARLVSYERWSEARRTAELLPLLEAGQRVALVSDAGLPGVNDPGARLIAAAPSEVSCSKNCSMLSRASPVFRWIVPTN